MKIRCVTNSIRLRVRKSDLQQLTTTGQVAESLAFPNGQQLRFVLVQATIEQAACNYEEGAITIQLPTAAVQQWVTSDEVGLDYVFPLANQQTLKLLIEKDFPCNHTEADYKDTFFELVEKELC